jgi:ubiquinone/menaquinone biosynthesis C-methylase UbiE
VNYFNPKSAAERYAKGRPDFHANTIQHVKAFLKLTHKLDNALDVACGTGLSTKALLEVAGNIYGTDISTEMLSHSLERDSIQYSLAPAEQQPFGDNIFDLITVSSGVHWFDIDAFLIEANRILKSKAWLVLYENYFLSEMDHHPAFKRWFPEVYLSKYPSPPRNNAYDWTSQNLNKKNFNLVNEEAFENAVTFNKKQLSLYFTTQSNIIHAVEKGETTYAEVENWLSNELAEFFESNDATRTIQYGNWIKFIQRVN